MSDTEGWAIVESGAIKVRTVSDTRRAAIINWLVTEAAHRITAHDSDSYIERMWQQSRGNAEAIEVTVSARRSETSGN